MGTAYLQERRRKVSAFNRCVGRKIKAGKTFRQAAKSCARRH